MKRLFHRICPSLGRYYFSIMTVFLLALCLSTTAFAVDDMWTAANRIIVDVYEHIAGISTVLAGLMSAVAVIGAKMSKPAQGRSGLGLAPAHLGGLGGHQGKGR